MGKIAVSYALQHPDRVIALLLSQYVDPHRGTRTGLFQMAQSDWALHLSVIGPAWVELVLAPRPSLPVFKRIDKPEGLSARVPGYE